MSQTNASIAPAAPASVDLIEQLTEALSEDRLELPGFPEAVLRVQRTIDSPDSSAEDVVKVLSSEPALAAKALKIANSVQFRRSTREVTELRTAVSMLGFNLVRSIAVAFAIRQLRMRESYSPEARAEIEQIWRSSVRVASLCYVLAKYCTRMNPDQALLAGLLHVLGRLYLVMRGEGLGGEIEADTLALAQGRHAEIASMILSSWGLPPFLQHAVEHQDRVDYESEGLSVTDLLISAKYLAVGGHDEQGCAALRRIAAAHGAAPTDTLNEYAEELRVLASALGGD